MKNEITGFNLRLIEKMQEQNITKADLCRITGLTTSMISYYCAGKRLPALSAAIKIAKAINTTVEYLAHGTSTANVPSYSVAENKISYSSKKSQLKPDEQSLDSLFDLLNQDGQARVISYIEDLLSTSKYKR